MKVESQSSRRLLYNDYKIIYFTILKYIIGHSLIPANLAIFHIQMKLRKNIEVSISHLSSMLNTHPHPCPV